MIGKVFWAGALAAMGERDLREVEQALHELARKELVRPARSELDGGRGRVRLLAPAGPRRLLRADPARRPRRPPPGGRRLDRAARRARARRPRRRARPPLPDRARAHPRRRPHERDARARGAGDPVPRSGRRARARARRRPRRGASGEGARARSCGPPRARPAARALGRGDAAAGPAAGRADGARGSARPAPRAGRPAGGRTSADRALDRALPAGRPGRNSGDHRGDRAARGRAARPRARRRLRRAGRDAPGARWPIRRRSSRPIERSPSPSSSISPSRHARSGSEAPPVATPEIGPASRTCAKRSGMAVAESQGRTAAVLYNNLADDTWLYEGPEAALQLCREGTEFCERRGITEYARKIAALRTRFQAEAGRVEEALDEAAALADLLQSGGDIELRRGPRCAAAPARRARLA